MKLPVAVCAWGEGSRKGVGMSVMGIGGLLAVGVGVVGGVGGDPVVERVSSDMFSLG